MADEVSDLNASLLLERENARQIHAAQALRITELEDRVKALDVQVDAATQGQGVPSHLVADITRRIKLGLPKDDAIACARRQHQFDLEQAKAKEPKVQQAGTSEKQTPNPTGPNPAGGKK